MTVRYHERAALLAAAMVSVLAIATPAWASCHQAFFSPQSYHVGENAGSVVLTVKNPGNLQRLRTVGYQTASGTAKPGSDFVAESGTLSFSPSATEKTIAIAIVNDAVNEGAQRFEVRLKPQDGSCIVDLGPHAVVTIDDDDNPKPTPTRDGDSDGAPPPPDGGGSGGGGGGAGGGGGTSTGGGTGGVDGTIDGSSTPTPSPTPTATDVSSSPEATHTVFAAVPIDGGGGLSGVWIALIVAGAIAAGSVATILVRRGASVTDLPPS